ncbi:PCC domain-containing protein [Planococcus lenghuensis]|uniref:DNA-binding protein n=1 Tax=Planococcus lenghuensis TaxID=2213202 RepID=A0A1Q2L2L6_9BACL|nr:PPC domain-containing DNA-binding protein [Planococcus lenghuensis]AQQ54695.1 DNA-binding protein [Planococcus lenghuensis]
MDNNRIQAVRDESWNRIVGRLMKDVDLFEGIKEVCRHFKVGAAQFQCLGSLQYATYLQIIRGDEPGLVRYSGKKQTGSAVEILSGSGFVGTGEDGELDVHFHGMVVDCDQQITGGHFLDGENPTAVTVEFIIFPIENVRLQRGVDPYWQAPIFSFYSKEGAENGDSGAVSTKIGERLS